MDRNAATRPYLRKLSVLLTLALRDLRGGLRGFGIFLACIALGVTAIIGVGSVSRSLSDGLAGEGRAILGGDVSFSLISRQIAGDELGFLQVRGAVAEIGLLRAMARRSDGEPALVEIKAVDQTYPLAGEVTLEPPGPLGPALASRDGTFGLVADAAFAARLELKPGDRVYIGDMPLQLRAILAREPDKLAGGIGFGPRVLMSREALQATGLVQPGTLIRWIYRIAVTPPDALPVSDAALDQLVAAVGKAFPQAGWEVRTRANVSPQFSKNLQRFTQFLILVGLTALIVGGVGVANAVRALVEAKQGTIATLKSLGATGGEAFAFMLIEVVAMACIGILIGAMVGTALPFVVSGLFGSLIPFPLHPAIYPAEIAAGFGYGLLTALVFSLAPLGSTHDVSVSALFRASVDPNPARLRRIYLALVLAAAALLVALIMVLSNDRRLAIAYIGGVAAAFVLLRLVAAGVIAGARRLPRPQRAEWRLALANLHRPGALTASVMLSLGLGLTLMVALSLIDGNIRNELVRSSEGERPNFFFVDVQSRDTDAFDAFLKAHAADGRIDSVPMMRGRIVKVGETRAEDIKAKENIAWVLEGDRGITFAASLPKGSEMTAGEWWGPDYKGQPLVSMEAEVAAGLGLKLGDSLTVNVLGRDITARIANLRKVNWRSLGINFVMIFSPNTFAGAPHSDLATLTLPGNDTVKEAQLMRDVAKAWPAVTSVRVKEVLDAINQLVGQLALAIRGASSIALLASVLVLGGALASGQKARQHDAVVLKVLGMTRGRLMASYALEYMLLGLVTAIFGVVAGMGAAWAVVSGVMGMEFVWLWGQALLAVVLALALTLLLGLAGTWRVLGMRPARVLREA